MKLYFQISAFHIIVSQEMAHLECVNIVNHREEFISNMIRMLSGGTSNDIKIVLEDGEIFANKDVLSSQSDYFATMFSNHNVKFIEGETNIVNLNYCSKKIMEKIKEWEIIKVINKVASKNSGFNMRIVCKEAYYGL